MERLEKECDDNLKMSLRTAHAHNQQIKDRLTSVFGKFEQLIVEQGRACVDRENKDELLKRQHDDLKAINEPATGMLRKLEEIKRQTNQIK